MTNLEAFILTVILFAVAQVVFYLTNIGVI